MQFIPMITHDADATLQDGAEPRAAPKRSARAARPSRKTAVKAESQEDEPMTDKGEDEAASASDDDFAAPTTGKRKVQRPEHLKVVQLVLLLQAPQHASGTAMLCRLHWP